MSDGECAGVVGDLLAQSRSIPTSHGKVAMIVP
jgi:hypothetical protein